MRVTPKDIDPYVFAPPGLKTPELVDFIDHPIIDLIDDVLDVKDLVEPFLDAVKDAEKANQEYKEKLEHIDKERALREFKQLLRDKFKIQYSDAEPGSSS
ncbi:MAG: hypothetical protein ACREV3_00690 [Gammaproteobacteria bacterium]